MDNLPFDDAKMEKALQTLAKEVESINEEDPRQAARLMRKLSDMTGLEMGAGMSEALERMEKGEDPDQLEAEMGDMLDNEDPFIIPGKKKALQKPFHNPPQRDETLYEM